MIHDCLSAIEVCRRWAEIQKECRYMQASFWRADSFRETEGQPMTYRRAKALNAVLERCGLPLVPGELLVGSSLGRFGREGSPEAMEEASKLLAAVGSRDFTTGFDHSAPDYPALLRDGIGGIRQRAEASLRIHSGPEQREFLESAIIALEGAEAHFKRWAEEMGRQAERHPQWSALLREQSRMLAYLSRSAPRTFREAIQLVWLMHCIMKLDDRYAMAFGRMDQYLYPFYRTDLEAGRLTPEFAQILLDHFVARVADGGDVQNICIGGVTPAGEDGTNPVSFMLLEAVKRIARPGANLTARIHAGTPFSFLEKCAEVIRTGIGFPAVFNDEVEIPALTALGYALEDARNYCFVGCIEVFIPGRQAPWSDSRFNLLQCVNRAIFNGKNSLTGAQDGPETGEPDSWEAFLEAFLAQMRSGLKAHIEAINAYKRRCDDRPREFTSPLMSTLISDCIERGLDQCGGGARYPANHGPCCMGIGSAADALMAIQRFVYEQKRFSLPELRRMLAEDFEGYESERQLLLRGAPKYGNDDPEVDSLAAAAAEAFGKECLKYRTPTGGRHWSLMAANVANIYAGMETGASADGRKSGEPLSDAASPTFGRDRSGPTATVRSVARLDYRLHPGGDVINMKLHPSALSGEKGLSALASLIRTCFDLGGIQLQFNTTDRAVLRDAMARPEQYENLVVRVSGFSAYFTSLDRRVQEDILARTEHVIG